MPVSFDWKRVYKNLYFPPSEPVLVDVPPFNYLMLDGYGDPNTSPEYAAVLEALFSMAYTLKFAMTKAGAADFTVFPAEGLWWVDDMRAFSVEDKSAWNWTMMIAQPPLVTAEWVEQARRDTMKKKGLVQIEQVRFENYCEGTCAQVLHTGPYAAEGPTVAKLHAFIEEQGLVRTGKHHEIYLGDARRAAAEKLKTVIRQPVKAGE
jgi:hypothetical protein